MNNVKYGGGETVATSIIKSLSHKYEFIYACPRGIENKVKNVLEQIHVRKSEYILKRIKIDGIASDFYLLFVPIIKDTEFVYPKCEFIDIYNH